MLLSLFFEWIRYQIGFRKLSVGRKGTDRHHTNEFYQLFCCLSNNGRDSGWFLFGSSEDKINLLNWVNIQLNLSA